jgi:hypothetical protein
MSKRVGTLVDESGMKICSCCATNMGIVNFSKNKRMKDGYEPYCKVCRKKAAKKIKEKNPDYFKDMCDKHNVVGPDGLTYRQRYYLQNKDKILENSRSYQRKKGKELRDKYKNKKLAYNRAREAAKIYRTPSWLSKDQKQEMFDTYMLRSAKSSNNEVYHVDHIVPLIGANVCGLHVPWNLQIIRSDDNLSKGFIYGGPDAWSYEIQMQMRRDRWDLLGKDT